MAIAHDQVCPDNPLVKKLAAVFARVAKLDGNVYLVGGKPHRLCACDPHKGDCPRGVRRTLATTNFSRCLIPANDVIAGDGVTISFGSPDGRSQV